jgi:PTS system fructose-specific IIC component
MLESLLPGSRAVLGGICAAMMATDMGGPINKAAYHFGTAAIAAGSPDIMAAVMVGGMVPPCGIAISMLIFRDKFTEIEHELTPSTFFLGLAFVTEGALPFLLTDILRVIPACMVGSGIAGVFSMTFGCTLMAPHGGIFVFPVVGQPILYLVALALGSLVTAVVLGLLKRPVQEAEHD